MLDRIKFENKLLCMDFNNEYVVIGDNKGFIYKYKDNAISKLFYCDSPVSNILIFNTDIFYTTWDGDVYKNDKHINLSQGIIKAMILYNKMLYIALDHNIYIVTIDLKIIKVIDVPHKLLSFSIINNILICGMNLPILGYFDNDNLLKIVNLSHETGILCLYTFKNKIYSGSVDGTVQKYDFLNILDNFEDPVVPSKILFKNDKWIRSIFSDFLFSSGKDAILLENENNFILYSHNDEIMKIIQFNNKILSIGLDCILNIYTKDVVLDDELEEINKLNQLFN